MDTIKDLSFGGDRPLFLCRNTTLERITITDGNGALKESSDLRVEGCRFDGLFPFWDCNRVTVSATIFGSGARAPFWYSNNIKISDSIVESSKMFRQTGHIDLHDVRFENGDQILWSCHNIKGDKLTISGGEYPFLGSKSIKIDGLKAESAYMFQYCKGVLIQHADIRSDDLFWESEDVTVYDSRLSGEFIGRHSRNLRLVRCHISGISPLCFCAGLILEDCTFDPSCTNAFEGSEVRATILSPVTSIRNPRTGMISAESFGEVTIDDNVKAPADCSIIARKK